MSELQTETEQKFGLAGVEAAQGFEAMVPANPVPKELDINGEVPTEAYKRYEEHLTQLGADLHLKRKEDAAPGDVPTEVVREYKTESGQLLDKNLTLSPEQAAHDLTITRNRDEHIAERQDADELARAIDELRRRETTESLRVETPQDGHVALDAQQHPETQPQVSQQDELQRALQDPAVLAAVNQRVEQASAYENYAFNHYANGLVQNARAAAASLVASFPELNGLAPEQLGTAIAVIAKRDAPRAQAILNHVDSISGLVKQGVEAQQAQQHRAAAQYQAAFARDAAQHDQAYDQWSRNQGTSPDEQEAIKEEVMAEFQRQGWSNEQIAHAYNSNLAMRSLSGQIQMHQAAVYRLGEKLRQSARRKISHPVPHVQRPGSPVERQSDSDHYLKKLEKPGQTLTAKEAAAFLTARRAQRR